MIPQLDDEYIITYEQLMTLSTRRNQGTHQTIIYSTRYDIVKKVLSHPHQPSAHKIRRQ